MDFALEAAYREHSRFSYSCLDRIVIRGFDQALQRSPGFLWWCQQLHPGQPITESWLASLARRFHEGVKTFAAEQRIPIVRADGKTDKHMLAEEQRKKMTTQSGVYLIVRARETTTTYRSREVPTAKDPNYRSIDKKIGFVDQYYFYLVDERWGPISLRFSSHPPFNVTVYLNGNRWLAREAERRGLEVATKDNSVVRVDDPARLQLAADALDTAELQSVCDRWAYRLLPVLTREEREKSFFRYRWFFHQVEMSHNVVFKNAKKLTDTLEHHVDLNRRHLQPHSLKSIFRGKRRGPYNRDMTVNVRHAFGGLTVFSAQYGGTRIKQYNNHQQTFRTEVCANNTHELRVNKALENFPALRARLLEVIERFQKAQSFVLDTTCNRGELAALAKPGRVNNSATAGIKLENERTIAVLTALPKLVHLPKGFRSVDLRPLVQHRLNASDEYRAQQATYDLRKLRGKHLVERIEKSRRFRLTAEGARVAVLISKLRDQLIDPLLTSARRPRRPPPVDDTVQPPDAALLKIGHALFDLTDQLALRPAA
jgi:hypothetical protein